MGLVGRSQWPQLHPAGSSVRRCSAQLRCGRVRKELSLGGHLPVAVVAVCTFALQQHPHARRHARQRRIPSAMQSCGCRWVVG